MTNALPDAEDLRAGRLHAWILLSGFFLIASIANAVYSAQGVAASPRFDLLTRIGMLGLFWYWFVQQVRPYRLSLPLDIGMFIAAAGVVLVPYYLWRCERWRGLGKCLALLGVYLGAWAAAFAFYLALL